MIEDIGRLVKLIGQKTAEEIHEDLTCHRRFGIF